ncbi:archaeal Glu-tRNAGln amidotransferase subunit E [Cenarchaeum symbiosum A]|uniref:Glutamyl-tRNA(Gln) amidotransferase subunit E n=1 Tax=Cenarchaeum symbiosum (strain A) TaxID=414004 RepID=A0RZ06_CENSY|nr:archaeal Glu-tRNAGln amidotransferase subunit E [Cenarchaeum symbiosum A]
MDDTYYERIGLKVGLEVHQQLATGRKLFCGCGQEEAAKFPRRITRRLRAARSETGSYDPAAVFEGERAMTMVYHAGPGISCLVEEDEEPPHGVDPGAREAVLIVASALNSSIFREVFPMRKMVVDGSNTSGFQRTMLVSMGGVLHSGGEVGVQSICLEEDAARLIGESGGVREYGLDRLGIPLIEIALEPIEGGPRRARDAALALGRLLRSTGRAARGIGSIRQDVNVSVSGGAVVEVKGVQRLDQLEKVVDFEARRQEGLNMIAEKLRGIWVRGPTASDMVDVTAEMKGTESKAVVKEISGGGRMYAVLLPGLEGILGYSPHEGIRLGKELAELAKSYGMGGIFHSDELPAYGITSDDVEAVGSRLGAAGTDAFIMVMAQQEKAELVVGQLLDRLDRARSGVPSETRRATPDGGTVFLRPRPGPARMYPETDVPPIAISDKELEAAGALVPEPWDEMVAGLCKRHGLNTQLAEQLLDSGYLGIFEKVAGSVPANFAASALCSTITELQRRGLDAGRLEDEMIEEAFGMLAEEKIAKESLGIIFGAIMRGDAGSVAEAIKVSGIGALSDAETEEILDRLIGENLSMIKERGERAAGALMGMAMKELRGRAGGEKVRVLLGEKIRAAQG